MVSYEEQVTLLREQLADVYAQEEDFSKAAQLLSGIDLDSGAAPAVCCGLGSLLLPAGCQALLTVGDVSAMEALAHHASPCLHRPSEVG